MHTHMSQVPHAAVGERGADSGNVGGEMRVDNGVDPQFGQLRVIAVRGKAQPRGGWRQQLNGM